MPDFGFRIVRSRQWDNELDLYAVVPDHYAVQLPHQCDSWKVVDEYTPHAEGVARLEEFIAQAQAALVRLRNRQHDDEDDDDA